MSKNEIKIGDKVKVIGNTEPNPSGRHYLDIGQIGEVINLQRISEGIIRISADDLDDGGEIHQDLLITDLQFL